MQACPKCGADDWRQVSESKQFTYKACGNCHYSPWLAKAEVQNAKEWFAEVIEESQKAREEYELAAEAYKAKETTLTMAKYNRAKRHWEASEKRLQIAEAISKVVELMESGQATLILPEIGVFQFEWGDFNLFKAIAK